MGMILAATDDAPVEFSVRRRGALAALATEV